MTQSRPRRCRRDLPSLGSISRFSSPARAARSASPLTAMASLIVNAPNDCDEAELGAFAHDKRMWVYKKLAEKDLLLSHRPTKEFVSGEGFAYLGRSHRLLLADRATSAPVKLERGRLVMRRDIAASRRSVRGR